MSLKEELKNAFRAVVHAPHDIYEALKRIPGNLAEVTFQPKSTGALASVPYRPNWETGGWDIVHNEDSFPHTHS